MIHLVGLGFLGSLFAEEWAKRAFAFNDREPMHLIDFDKFEERNGEWRIQKRLVAYDWSTVTPVTGTNLMQPSFLTGKRAPDDAWHHILD